MSDIYATLQVSPRKKRCPPDYHDDNTFTPKKLRTAYAHPLRLDHSRPPTPPPTSSRSSRLTNKSELPAHLSRLYSIQTALQHALSHALATCAVSPSSDTGLIRNVLNHMSLTTYSGLTTQFDIDDLRRLCWLWEWDPTVPPQSKKKVDLAEEDENPFLVDSSPTPPSSTDWTRGAMGLVVSSTTHYSKRDRKRVPAYGIGIEVEMDIDKDMGGGMAAVARWTAATETRRSEFRNKLKRWAELHRDASSVPQIPLADLPEIAMPAKISAFTRTLASASPKGALSSLSLPGPPSSPSRSPTKSPVKRTIHEFAVPFPITSKTPSKSSVLFPQTPSRRAQEPSARTPTTSIMSESSFNPSTPVHQKGAHATTVPQTPTSSRRQALYERIRARSLTASPTKAASSEVKGGKLTRDQIARMGQDEMRRRCLLGRLGGVAESVWMLFSTPVAGSSATPTSRKRRALPTSEVVTAVIKSSPVPISSAEAGESLSMLAKLCPFFVKELAIAGQEWLEMPASHTPLNAGNTEATPTKKTPVPPPSPGKHTGVEELVTRSPRRVKREAGGLRQVREIIRKELELQD